MTPGFADYSLMMILIEKNTEMDLDINRVIELF